MEIDGYYYDGKTMWVMYKKKCGRIVMKKAKL